MSKYTLKAYHTVARLMQSCEGLTGADLEQELLRLTDGEQHSVFVGFEPEPSDMLDDETTSNASRISMLLMRLDRYTPGIDSYALFDGLSEMFTVQVQHLYPAHDIVNVQFMHHTQGLAWTSVTLRNVAEAARFCIEYTDGYVPEDYTIDTLFGNDLFLSTLVDEFNRSTALASVLGLHG